MHKAFLIEPEFESISSPTVDILCAILQDDVYSPGLYIINAQFYHSGQYECVGQTVTAAISAAARVTITGQYRMQSN